MDLFRKTPRRPHSTLLEVPPPRRMSTPAGDRLATILENGGDGPARENAPSRHSNKTWSTKSRGPTLPRASAETTPPPYASREWRPDDLRYFAGDEKSGPKMRLAGRRGGLGRFLIIALIVLVVIVALAVGLGVGLSRRNKTTERAGSGDAESSEQGGAQFPLGQYTFVTSLRSVQTDCTSNPATWRCYPYSTSQGSNSTNGLALFNWILTSPSQDFPSNASAPSTTSSGTSTSLTVSASRDPFSIPLKNQTLTYINDNNNPRYTFLFTYPKIVVPSTALTSNNAATTCYFNQTQFIATLYLSNSRLVDYPGDSITDSAQVQGGYPRWPYAVEIREVSNGGQDTPVCYETTNGVMGARVEGLMQQSGDRQCSCNYRNFDA
ncbi:hypothetical protein BDZ85DRAFT_268459 [Elsinoe ampelina]|uniref:Tat pathway signal sequence n=1 Tax=Elsinoe ampelina TaxID=302913 RepID=A0A6A6G1F0_9PEZI|nr:hypothetical protein BDZ85DRAFT_268459 [Elsinoe ampelina]